MASAPPIDEIDREIVALLEEDARRTLAEIAERVTLSAPAVKRRIDRLQAQGVIVGWTIEVDHAKLGRPLQAFTELRFAGSTPVDEITATAAGLPEVEAVFTMAGDPDALVWMRVADVDHLKHVVDQLRRSGRVTATKTLVVLGRWTRRSGSRDARRAPRRSRAS
jgi:Lrp/AsnC family transcriptional regulator, leucine-responsive regulatory protein